MNKYLCIHTMGKNAVTRQQAEQLAEALQQDPKLRGYRSFINLSEGKIACVIEGPDQQSISTWFQKHQVPVDWIGQVELEGDRGQVRDTRQQPVGTGMGQQTNAGLSA